MESLWNHEGEKRGETKREPEKAPGGSKPRGRKRLRHRRPILRRGESASINSLIRENACSRVYLPGDELRMTPRPMTFGAAIAAARKTKGLSQKELAALIVKDDGGGPISPQYLNDIEHDRRSPTSDHLIKQFARVLGEDEGYLFVLAGKIPEEIRKKAKDRQTIVSSFANFRRTVIK